MSQFKTQKSALAAGLRTYEKWLKFERNYNGAERGPMAPREDASPVIVKGIEFFRYEDCEEAISQTEGERRGLKLSAGAEPAGKRRRQSTPYNTYDVYRISDFEPKPVRRNVPAAQVDLLRAVFTVNKSAKRYRDAGMSHWEYENHGFARSSKNRKERLYALKDAGIMAAHRAGRLEHVGYNGGLAVYRGEGYVFHSCLVPAGADMSDASEQDHVFIDAAPKGVCEARLKDAEATLDSLDTAGTGYTRLKAPRFEKPKLAPRVGREEMDEDDEDLDDEFDQDELM